MPNGFRNIEIKQGIIKDDDEGHFYKKPINEQARDLCSVVYCHRLI